MPNLFATTAAGPLLMFASAFLFAVLDVLIKILGPSFRVWDIAFYRFGFGLVILTVVFGRRRNPFNGSNPKLREQNGPVIIYLYFCLIGTLVTLPSFIANPQIPTNPGEFLIVGGIVLISISAQLLMNQGFRYCRSWEGGLFLTSELFFISIFGICFLNELVNWRFWVGGFLIFGSVVALNTYTARGAAHPAKLKIS
ncbi:MAG: DMT family transporter [Pseudomonadota bacterium]